MTKPVGHSSDPIANLAEAEQREALLGVLGQHLMSQRNHVLREVRELIESEEKRSTLARLFREPYERAAGLGATERDIMMELVKEGLDTFAMGILMLLEHEGSHLKINDDECVVYRLWAEVRSTKSGRVVIEQEISDGGEDRAFADYWGRWRNRYRSVAQNADETKNADEAGEDG